MSNDKDILNKLVEGQAMIAEVLSKTTHPVSAEDYHRERMRLSTGKTLAPRFVPEPPKKVACKSILTNATFTANVQQQSDGKWIVRGLEGYERPPTKYCDEKGNEMHPDAMPPQAIEHQEFLPDASAWPRSIASLLRQDGKFPSIPGATEYSARMNREHFMWANFWKEDLSHFVGREYDESMSVEFQSTHASEVEALQSKIAAQAQELERLRGVEPARVVPGASRI